MDIFLRLGLLSLLLVGCARESLPPETGNQNDSVYFVGNSRSQRSPHTCEHLTQSLVDSESKLLVFYFWAPWLPASRNQLQLLEEISDRFPEQTETRIINIDNEDDWTGKWNIISLPTILITRDGEILERIDQFDSVFSLRDIRDLVRSKIDSRQ